MSTSGKVMAGIAASCEGPRASESRVIARKVKEGPEPVNISSRAGQGPAGAIIRLLQGFFTLAADDEELILERLHRQSGGVQFGHNAI
jgi:hypothetical protein